MWQPPECRWKSKSHTQESDLFSPRTIPKVLLDGWQLWGEPINLGSSRFEAHCDPRHSELVTSQVFLWALSRAVLADAEMTVCLVPVCSIPTYDWMSSFLLSDISGEMLTFSTTYNLCLLKSLCS